MKYYKLTDYKDCTTNSTQWGVGITHKATGKGKELCSSDVIHVYDHPLKAIMFNPIHANFKEYHLWEVRVKKVVANDTLKVGVKQCTTIRQIDAPVISTEQRVRFAILCALEVYNQKEFVTWANNWLSGKDRTGSAAESAAELAAGSAESAALLAAESAARSAESAARSAESAALSATWSALSAESAAELAALSATWSAWSAALSAALPINFIPLIIKAIGGK